MILGDGAGSFIYTSSVIRSMYWGAGAMTAQGACAIAEATPLASGPVLYTAICTDADADTIQGSTLMPDGWDGGTVTFTMAVTQTATDTAVIELDFAAQCVSSDEAISAWNAPPTGEQPASITLTVASDWLEDDTAAVTVSGTSCAAGDMLYWIGSVDAGATTSTALTTLHIIGVKMEYTTVVGGD